MTDNASATMTDDTVYIHPDINNFIMLQGIDLTLFKNNDGRLSITMDEKIIADADEAQRLNDKMVLREALRLRDSLIKMYPLSEYEL